VSDKAKRRPKEAPFDVVRYEGSAVRI
jgi:hypothetical protein